jgi:hypothetical protein
MKADELRIGNLVYSTSLKQLQSPSTVIQVSEFGAGLRQNKYEHNEGSQNLYPIPLTEEWLLKLGFEESKIHPKDLYFREYNNFWIGYSMREKTIHLNDGEGYEGANIPTKYEFLHQLMNLYFALTNEELTIHK